MNYADYDQSNSIRNYLYGEIPGLKKCLQREPQDKLKAAFLVRDWATATATYSQRELLIEPPYNNLSQLLTKLQAFEGGVWCGGCAELFTMLLRACFVEAITFSYGQGDLSHVTTIVGITHQASFQFYLIDAYLGYHFEDTEGNLLEFTKMLKLITQRKYEQIVRVDKKLQRHLLCHEGKRSAAFYKWLFDNESPPSGTRISNEAVVYSGASYGVAKLLVSGGFADLANRARGEQPLETFMLDLMLVRPSFSRIKPTCVACYLDWDLHEKVAQLLGKEISL